MKNLHRIAKVFGLVMLGAALLFFTACAGKYTGGGFLGSGNPGKATFGFTMEAFDTVDDGDLFPDKFRGQFQYNDHEDGIHFKCRICEGFIGPFLRSGWFFGELDKPIEENANGDLVYCRVRVLDLSEPGGEPSEYPDFISVELLNASCEVRYDKAGPLEGGNVQFHLSQGNRGESFEDGCSVPCDLIDD